MENLHPPELSHTQRFFRHIARNGIIVVFVISFSLFIGMCGYHYLEKMSWLDAYLNAAMILAGMGPITPLETDSGKLFAGSYALFSGIVFLVAVALLLAPAFHRVMHKFHMGEDKQKLK